MCRRRVRAATSRRPRPPTPLSISQAFVWSHPETGTSLLTFVNNNYGSLITVPGSGDALLFMYQSGALRAEREWGA